MTDFNPYQAPTADLTEATEKDNGIRRIGKNILFVPNGVELPHRCIKCNAPSTVTKTKTFYYNGYVPLIIFVVGLIVLVIIGQAMYVSGLFILVVIISIFTRKSQKIKLGLCDYHYKKRLYLGGFWLAVFMGSLALAFFGMTKISTISYLPKTPYFLIQMAMFVGVPISVLGTAVSLFLASATRVDSEGVSIKGLGKKFLYSFKF